MAPALRLGCRLTIPLIGVVSQMPEAALIPVFLKYFALKNGFKVYDCMYGSINISSARPIQQSAGGVYGIWAELNQPPKADFLAVPGFPGWYPIYWGKDISPVSRLKAHVKGHKNGNINLPAITELKDANLIFGAILVSNYADFEKLLHHRVPPFRGSRSTGRLSTVVSVR